MQTTPGRACGPPSTVVLVLSAMLTALVAIVLARVAYGLLLAPMQADLGLSLAQAGNLGTLTALGYLLFVLPGGVAAARWGTRNAVLGGLLIVTLGFVGLAVARDYAVIAALMLLLGVGTAGCFAPMLSLIATWFPLRRGLMIGWMTTGIGGGMFLAGLLVPQLMRLFGPHGWRHAWGLFAVVGAAVFLLVLLGVRDPPALQAGGSAPAAAADKWRIYRHPRIITVGLVYGVLGATYIVQALFMVSFAQASGIDGAVVGALFSMAGLLSLAAGPLWGWLSDRWNRASVLLLSMALVTAAMALPLLAQSLPVFFVHFLLTGTAFQGAFTMVQTLSTDQVAPRHIPIAVSYVTLFFAGGQFLGPAASSWLIGIGGFKAALAFAWVLLLLGLALAYRIRRFPAQPAVP